MCGIYGYIGNESAYLLILAGLQKLNYRGYDSWGMVTLDNGNFHIIKRLGYVTKSDITEITIPGNIGIGHVRWATHGLISEKNAHPHFDCKNEIAIVHNGVVYNENSIRNNLLKNGHIFNSNTDSELIAHLLEEKVQKKFSSAIYESLKEIDAQYSLLILTKKEQNKIYAARNKSPLKIGISKNGFHISSDVVSFVGIASEYIDLEDGDVAEISINEFKIYDKNNDLVQRKLNHIDILEEIIVKEPPYFLKEIQEEEIVVKNIINHYLKDNNIDFDVNLNGVEAIESVILTGSGSSFFASIIGEYYLRNITKIDHVESVLAAELMHKYADIPENTLLIALTQSGETRDTLDAIEFARKKGIPILTLVNRPCSEASKISNFVIEYQAGLENSVIASKTFVAEVLVLLLLSIYIAKMKKTIEKNNIKKEIRNLPLYVREIFRQSDKIKQIAKKYYNKSEFYPLSMGINIPIALEIGRKLEEGLCVHTIGTSLGSSAELKHGPITMVNGKTLIFIIPGADHKKILTSMKEAKFKNAKIIAVATKGDEMVRDIADDTIWIPKANKFLSPILCVIPLQLLAYYIGEEKGRKDCFDRPKNLAKSVTV